MAEYLEKSAVIKAIHDEIYDGGKWNGGWYEHSEEQAEKNFTKRINAITPVTKEHGEWVDMADSIDQTFHRHDYFCPKCNCKATDFIGGTEDWWCYRKPNFCPYCGADMRGKKE